MDKAERDVLEKNLGEAIRKLAAGKPFLVSVCILDHEAVTPGDKNHTEVFFLTYEPLDRMVYKRAKVLIEGFWSGVQTFLNSTAINPQNTVLKGAEQKQTGQQQYR